MPYENYYNPFNVKLSESQKQVNALHIGYNLIQYGFSLNAAAGMLGNFDGESTLNPNIVETSEVQGQNRFPGLGNYGFGLAQWTPYYGIVGSTESERKNYHGTNKPTYGQWARDLGYTFNAQNGGTGGEMYPQLLYLSQGQGGYSDNNSYYPGIKFNDYKVIDVEPEEAARIWYRNYERSRSSSYGNRPELARKWYDYLYEEFSGNPPKPPDPPDPPEPIRKSTLIWGGKHVWRKLPQLRR